MKNWISILTVCIATLLVSIAPNANDSETELVSDNSYFTDISIDDAGLLKWSVKEYLKGARFEIQEWRWNKYETIATMKSTPKLEYSYQLDTTCMLFHARVKVEGDGRHSENAEYLVKQEVTVKGKCFSPNIVFSRKTKYELYDAWGQKHVSGCDTFIDATELNNGVYYLSYGNSTEKFIKRKR